VADLVSAGAAYQKGDFEAAFKDYRALAELGQPTAQFNVAVMYARGEGTRQSEIYAYAWASLAAENGLEKAKVLADSLRPALSAAPGSEPQSAHHLRGAQGHVRLCGAGQPVAYRIHRRVRWK
jgi:TPR repeat protein